MEQVGLYIVRTMTIVTDMFGMYTQMFLTEL